jgi:hypothetical protein
MLFGFENEEMMGQRVGNVTYRQLVKLGAVTPYELVVMSVKREDIKQFINNNTWVRDEQYFESAELQTRFIASIILADKAYKKGYTNKLLSFHSRNSHAINFEKAMINLKDDSLFTSFNDLDFIGRCMGGQANTNKSLLNLLQESKKGVISNARVLTEGVSVPCIDSVLFCDPKTSAVDLAQGISRSIRLYPGKDISYILLPVIVDEEGNIENTSYQRMIDLLDYLSGFDEVLEEEINIVTQSQNRTRIVSSRVVNTDELEIDGVDINEFYNELSIQIWGRVKSNNHFWNNEDRLSEFAADKTTRNELTEVDAALRRLEDDNYRLWKKLAPHIPLPNKGMSEEEAGNIALNYTGTYEQFRQDHMDIIGAFTSIANLKSNDYTKGSELIAKYCSHMTRSQIQWKTISIEEVIGMMNDCKSKKDVRTKLKASFNMNIKRYPHLKEAFDYYNELPNTPTGLKVGTRRGGGWKLK